MTAKTDVYRLVLDVETSAGDPAKWQWAEVLDLGGDEGVRVVSSTKFAACQDCGHRCDPVGKCERCGSDTMQPGDTRCVVCDGREVTYEVITYDLWSDGEGGLTVNNLFKSGRITAHPEDSDEELLKKACELVGGDPAKLHVDQNTDNSGGTIYVLDEQDNPACELRLVKEGK